MKISILIISLFLSSIAMSATKSFDLKMELSIDGKHVSSPHIISLPNQKASITQRDDNKKEESFIEVTASDVTNDKIKNGIFMKFVVGYNKEGQRKIISQPEILAKAGEEAEITVGSDDATETLKLKVVANRVQK